MEEAERLKDLTCRNIIRPAEFITIRTYVSLPPHLPLELHRAADDIFRHKFTIICTHE